MILCAGGTHPTGVHSCFKWFCLSLLEVLFSIDDWMWIAKLFLFSQLSQIKFFLYDLHYKYTNSGRSMVVLVTPPPGQISFIFMRFFGKFGPNNR